MATEVAAPAPKSLVQRSVTFYHDVMAELRKVTWPDRPQVQQLSIGVVILSLFVGFVIWALDLGLQAVLVKLPQMLFGA